MTRSSQRLAELEEIGFVRARWWQRSNGDLELFLDRLADVAPALYAFVVGGNVMYVGKTNQPLLKRLYGYAKGGGSQRTSVRVRGELLRALERGREIDILVLHDPVPRFVGAFRLNLPAGLEDDLIERLQPGWNHAGQRRQGEATPLPEGGEAAPTSSGSLGKGGGVDAEELDLRRSFPVTIGRTYCLQGFFNVPVEHGTLFGVMMR